MFTSSPATRGRCSLRRCLACLVFAGLAVHVPEARAQWVREGSREGTLVVNYYRSAPDPELEKLRELAVEALGIHLRGELLVTQEDIGWKSSPRAVQKDMERLVRDLMRIRHFEEQEPFQGFSDEVAALLRDVEELDMRDVDRFRSGGGRGFEERMYVLIEQRIQEVLLQAGVELGRFVNRGLLQKIGTVEQALPDSTFAEWMTFDPDAPLTPMEVDFSLETMSLIGGNDTSEWPDSPSEAGDAVMQMMGRILDLLEAQDARISALEGGVSRGSGAGGTSGVSSTPNVGELAQTAWNPSRPSTSLDPELRGLNLPPSFDIRFYQGSSQLTLTAQLQLNEVMEFMGLYPQLRVVCTGHADATGDRTANLTLSKARAKAVQSYLLESGVAPTRVLLNFFGEERATNQGALDRRVEVAFFVRDSRTE